MSKHKNEIRIQHVNDKTFKELHNIAGNQGVSLASLLKPKLREIADSYPDKLKQPPVDY